MNNTIKNAAPQLVFWGIDDQSGRLVSSAAEAAPIHTPFSYGFFQKGPTDVMFVDGAALKKIYGDASFDYRGPYVTHSTPFINGFARYANVQAVKRLKPANSATATLQLGLELLPTAVPTYERNEDGTYKLDALSQPIATGSTVQGYIGRWTAKVVSGEIGTSTQGVGQLVEGDTQSVFYPLMDFRCSSFGDHGNNTGIRIFPRLTTGLTPVDEEVVMDQSAFLYGMQIMQRASTTATPSVLRTLTNALSVDFALKAGAYNKFTEAELYWDEVVLSNWRNVKQGEYGPFDAAYLYTENLEAVLTAIMTAEYAVNPDRFANGVVKDLYLINPLTATFVDGVPYESLIVQGVLDGGIEFDSISTHYLLGGADGTLGNAAFNELVAAELANWNDGDEIYEDLAKYPFSAMYDSGFDIATSKLLPRVLSIRPDVHIALACQDVTRKANTADEDSSIGAALRTAISAYPESTVFGTTARRGIVVEHSGYCADDTTYKGMLPGTYEVAMKRARYLGSSDGIMKSRWAYDQETSKIITYLSDVTNLDKKQNVRNADWDRGLVYFVNYDHNRGMVPYVRTICDDDTSVLTSDLVMQIAAHCNKVAFWVWRDLVGNGKLSDELFIQRSNEKIQEYTNGRFDGRCRIVPETYYSTVDTQRGFSYSCRIHIYAPNTKLVGAVAIVTHRLADLQAAA